MLLNVPGGQIGYDDEGSGPLVVLVPAMNDVRAEYRFLAPKLLAAGYRVVTTDLRGLGESSVNWPEYGPDPGGTDLLALLRHLDGGPALVVGCSSGAGSAVYAATESPDLVRGLVLVCPFIREIPTGAMGKVIEAMGKAVMNVPFLTVAAWMAFFNTIVPNKPADWAEYTATLRANLSQPGRAGAVRGYVNASRGTGEQRLAKVSAPALVVMGAADPDFPDPEAQARWVADRLDAELMVVEGAGHHPHVEFPDRIAARITAFDA